jgi:hypothetical protein
MLPKPLSGILLVALGHPDLRVFKLDEKIGQEARAVFDRGGVKVGEALEDIVSKL